MTRRHGFVLAFILALGCLPARAAAAQSTHPFSLDATLGGSMGWGGTYADRGGVAATLLLVPEHRGAWLGGVGFGGRASLAFGDKCLLASPQSSTCLPEFPDLVYGGVYGGVEHSIVGITTRSMAGPIVVGDSHSGLGGQVYVDAAAGLSHVAVVVAARGAMFGRFNAEPLRLGSLEVGLRVR